MLDTSICALQITVSAEACTGTCMDEAGHGPSNPQGEGKNRHATDTAACCGTAHDMQVLNDPAHPHQGACGYEAQELMRHGPDEHMTLLLHARAGEQCARQEEVHGLAGSSKPGTSYNAPVKPQAAAYGAFAMHVPADLDPLDIEFLRQNAVSQQPCSGQGAAQSSLYESGSVIVHASGQITCDTPLCMAGGMQFLNDSEYDIPAVSSTYDSVGTAAAHSRAQSAGGFCSRLHSGPMQALHLPGSTTHSRLGSPRPAHDVLAFSASNSRAEGGVQRSVTAPQPTVGIQLPELTHTSDNHNHEDDTSSHQPASAITLPYPAAASDSNLEAHQINQGSQQWQDIQQASVQLAAASGFANSPAAPPGKPWVPILVVECKTGMLGVHTLVLLSYVAAAAGHVLLLSC